MSKKIISVTVDSEVLSKVKEGLDGRPLSVLVNKLLDEYIGFSKQQKEQELNDVREREELEEKNRIANEEFERDRLSKITPEEREQNKKDQERSDRMAALSYSGVRVTDEEWRSGVLNKDRVEEKPVFIDTSEFTDQNEL